MTSDLEALKTNEFLRRRKLRLQQVREQSKDIAKRIRQRAQAGKLQHITEVDEKKEREYLQRQEKLIERLEQLYAKGIRNVGTSHKHATEVPEQDVPVLKDLSKFRGKEAAAELRRKKQEKLDEQKKLLERKSKAREAANEISREKSGVLNNKLLGKSLPTKPGSEGTEADIDPGTTNKDQATESHKGNIESHTNDMATQWPTEPVHEWIPNVPELSLPKDDSAKDPTATTSANKSEFEKYKRQNLFALSEEMPSSLRGGLADIQEEPLPVRPSLTLVSEYLQNRSLRLRETGPVTSTKKSIDDLSNIKQTIIKTRTSKNEGNSYTKACHVLDGQVLPTPVWQAETSCHFCNDDFSCDKNNIYKPRVTNSQINKIFSPCKPTHQGAISNPHPGLRAASPFRRNQCYSTRSKGSHMDKSELNNPESSISKRNSVTMYNHANRDIQTIPCGGDGFVQREEAVDEDAYSLAVKESEADVLNKDPIKKVQNVRNKVAMSKIHVEKEYQDTMAFLHSMPKGNTSKVTKTAFMDESRQKEMQEKRQRKMQMEFRKIEKECRKHSCGNSKSRRINLNQSRNKSPQHDNTTEEFEANDTEYSWMPVPEGDGNLAVHTVPSSHKEGKSNNVKFSKVDSYHEYRSRHKHTPPTKDNPLQEKPISTLVETVVVQSDDSVNQSSYSESSSILDLLDETKTDSKKLKESLQELSNAERIIIYKILDSKKAKKEKSMKQAKLIDKIVKALNSDSKLKAQESHSAQSVKKRPTATQNLSEVGDNVDKSNIPVDDLQEGVYKTVSQKESHRSVIACYTTNIDMWQATSNREPWWDNITSMYYSQGQKSVIMTKDEFKYGQPCSCAKSLPEHQQREQSTAVSSNAPSWDCSDKPLQSRSPRSNGGCKCRCSDNPPPSILRPSAPPPSATTSVSSFKTAKNDNNLEKSRNAPPDGGYIKMIDEVGKETGQFYIGASGFLKDNGYELVIQLKKKDKEDSTVTMSDNQNPVTNDGNVSEEKKQHTNTTDKENLSIPVDSQIVTEPHNVTPNLSVTCKSINTDTQIEDNRHVLESELPSKTIDSRRLLVNVEDKGVGTSFQDSNITYVDKANTDAVTKPTVSTCTQTTFQSPSQRPVYVHMSSSTSTAYMSPPELLLPNLMKQKHSEDQKCNIRQKQKGKNYCNCRRCVRKILIQKLMTSSENTDHENSLTPPDTNGSYHNHRHNINNGETVKDSMHSSPIASYRKKKHTCQHSKSKSDDKLKRQSECAFDKHIKKPAILKRQDKQKINPIIKDYVNKLLHLNKEGIRAIEITNQECSSVSTPGSSVIDISGNISNSKTAMDPKISLQHLKNLIKEQVVKEFTNNQIVYHTTNVKNRNNKHSSQMHKPTKRHVHRVKSLNVSKQLQKTKKVRTDQKNKRVMKNLSGSSTTDDVNFVMENVEIRPKRRSKSYPTPRLLTGKEDIKNSDILFTKNRGSDTKQAPIPTVSNAVLKQSSETESSNHHLDRSQSLEKSINISTQTSHTNNNELNLVKIAEDKLQNMEKIADLTEKCTQRLSNLAKVLDEVRKNKTVIYNQLSNTDSAASDSDQKSDKHEITPKDVEVSSQSHQDSKITSECSPLRVPAVPPLCQMFEMSDSSASTNDLHPHKSKGKPPPALSRLNLKHGMDLVIPHELSTVLEVDSPLSVKLKNPSFNDKKSPNSELAVDSTDIINAATDKILDESMTNLKLKEPNDPDILQSNNSKQKHKQFSTDSSDDSKIQMMDLKQFNDIMLKPFISLQEYAKQNNIDTLDEGSNLENVCRNDINEELSSLHSDSSLPDVIAELLKRNLISEPFKFDTGSNFNSNTMSSDSTMSVLALSRIDAAKRNLSGLFTNKQNVSESSDTISMSSNPDLENAFKKLGMGWASSTLKKTKERLALSSSSNSSNTSICAQVYRVKNTNDSDVSTIAIDSKVSNKQPQRKSSIELSKHAEQQTSFSNSTTVKDFLANELAKKITFSNSRRNDTEDEFVSLYETKMPEEIACTINNPKEDNNDTLPSGNRARTSTPVQLYKSMTYQSSSSSNMSNGLFSNADELSSVKGTSNSIRNHSTSDKDDLTIPNCSLKIRKGSSDCSKSD